MDDDRKKYNSMETLLQKINKNFISLSEADNKRNNEILESIVISITEEMKENDKLFAEMFQRIFYGGSYYDGLKVAHPDEYDLDLLLTLPSQYTYTLSEASNVPGFVHVTFQNYTRSLRKSNVPVKPKLNLAVKETIPVQRNVAFVPQQHAYQQPQYYAEPYYHQPHYYQHHSYNRQQPRQRNIPRRERDIDKLINRNGYLDTSKVLRWMQGVVQKALNTFERDGNGRYILETPRGYFYATSGPAYLNVTGSVGPDEVIMHIDLVPCFVFGEDRWPKGSFRINPINEKPNFFIVPKQLRGIANTDQYWRLSFQEQERVLLENKEKLKQTIKLLKKMRDFHHHDIASYFIKTVALWAIDEKDSDFWNTSPLSYVFMTILKDYQKCLESGEILYYWNQNYNLLGKLNPSTLININNRVQAIIDDIERHGVENPLLIGKYLVSSEELLKLK